MDKREYRVVMLSNGLRRVMVSDPVTDKAAASLDAQQLLAFIDAFIAIDGPQLQRRKLSIQYFGRGAHNFALPDVVERETAERVAFANVPLPAEKASDEAA